MKLQKHEREAIRAIKAVAKAAGVSTRLFKRGRHPTKIEFVGVRGRATLPLPSSPGDATWAVRLAEEQARVICARLCGAG